LRRTTGRYPGKGSATPSFQVSPGTLRRRLRSVALSLGQASRLPFLGNATWPRAFHRRAGKRGPHGFTTAPGVSGWVAAAWGTNPRQRRIPARGRRWNRCLRSRVLSKDPRSRTNPRPPPPCGETGPRTRAGIPARVRRKSRFPGRRLSAAKESGAEHGAGLGLQGAVGRGGRSTRLGMRGGRAPPGSHTQQLAGAFRVIGKEGSMKAAISPAGRADQLGVSPGQGRGQSRASAPRSTPSAGSATGG